MEKLVLLLHCLKSGEKLHFVKTNICHWQKGQHCEETGDCGTLIHMVCGACVSVKECPETVHKKFHADCE